MSIRSDLALPGVVATTDPATSDVVFSRGSVPASLASVTAEFPNGQCNESELLLNIPDAARYLIRGGTEIIVDEAPAADAGDVAAFLLGSAFGVLCHQRGTPALHASAVEIAGGCVAFTGDSGAGKSTTVAALSGRGYQLVADDVCVLHRDSDGHPLIWPGLTRLRLWEDAFEALAFDRTNAQREFRGLNKYLVPLEPPRDPACPRRLRRVYQLDSVPDGERTSVTRLRGAAAVEVLIENIYRAHLAEHMGRKSTLFNVCAAAAQAIPVFRFSRPRGFDKLAHVMDVLEEHLHNAE